MRSSYGERVLNLVVVLWLVFGSQQPAQISGLVQDENDQPVGAVEVILHAPLTTARTSTDDLGKFHFDPLPPGQYTLDFNRTGFFRLSGYALDAKEGSNEITVTMNHETELRSSLDVLSSAHEIVLEQMRHEEQLAGYEIRENPVPNSHDLLNSLPALPGVVQDASGEIHVAGARQQDTLYTLDGFEVNNPGNGAFSARVNVDTVREANLNTGRYGAQFANAATGVLALQTDTGDDHRRFSVTNPFPALSTQRGVHLGNWFPRINFSGPIKPGRAWYSNATTVQHDFTLVTELPRGADISQQWSVDNLLRGQYNATPSQSLQGNFLYNYVLATNVGLNAFAPAATTFDVHSDRYFVSARDQFTIKNGLIDIGVASDKDYISLVPQGLQQYVLTPTGPQGNYFENQVQHSDRWQGLANAMLSGRNWLGKHDLRFGFNIDRSHVDQVNIRRSVLVVQTGGATVRNSFFTGSGSVSAAVTQGGVYAEDLWQLRRDVSLQSTFRLDRNDFINRFAPQPRFILNWIPGQHASKFTAGWGLYYQPVYPLFLAQGQDQGRLDFLSGPGNSATAVITQFEPAVGLRQPFFSMSSAEWQQQWSERYSSSIHLMDRRQHHGLSYENVSAEPSVPTERIMQLTDQRADRYDSVGFTLRRSLRDGSDLMVDYTYSRARSNQIFTYAVDNLVLSTQAAGRLAWDTPNRVISRGAFPTKRGGLLFSYFAEYHTGFPFSSVDSRYIVVTPDGFRYPSFFSLNFGVEKRFLFNGQQWALRLAAINLTAHHNPNVVINNVDAPNFGTFAGGQSRALTFRLRLVGRS
jgi:hypothetical protein